MNILKNFFADKRKRVKLPLPILITGIFFIFYPIINYIGIVAYFKVYSLKYLFSKLTILQIGLVFFPIIIGIGLLLVKKWSWYSFLIYFAVLILHNTYSLFRNPVAYNYISSIEVLVVLFLTIYFIKKDISAPYFKMFPRGFRGEKRIPINITLKINGNKVVSSDFSNSGFYANYIAMNFVLNQEVEILIQDSINLKLKAGVVRIDLDENEKIQGIGFAFRNISQETELELNKLIKTKQRKKT